MVWIKKFINWYKHLKFANFFNRSDLIVLKNMNIFKNTSSFCNITFVFFELKFYSVLDIKLDFQKSICNYKNYFVF